MNYRYAALAVMNTLLIIYLSSLPGYSITGRDGLSEQVVSNIIHIPAYGILSFLWFMSFKKTVLQRKPLPVNCLVCIALVLFAISDEIHQLFVPGRFASVLDAGLDFLGIGIGYAVFRKIRSSNAFSRFLNA